MARDGDEALRRFTAARPDLVLLDLMLPGVDGLEVCRRIRAQSNVPVIMLTAKGQDSDIFKGYQLQADMYLTKPFNPSELIAFARRILSSHDDYGEKVYEVG